MYVQLSVKKLRGAGIPEAVIDQLKSIGSVEVLEGEEFITILVITLIAYLLLWLVLGTITTWIFTAILHLLKIAPWQVWR